MAFHCSFLRCAAPDDEAAARAAQNDILQPTTLEAVTHTVHTGIRLQQALTRATCAACTDLPDLHNMSMETNFWSLTLTPETRDRFSVLN